MRIDRTYGGEMVMLDDGNGWRVETYPDLLDTVADRYRGTPLDNLRAVTAGQIDRQVTIHGHRAWQTVDLDGLNRLQLLFVLAEAMDWDWFDTTTVA